MVTIFPFPQKREAGNKISKMRTYGFSQPIVYTATPGLNFVFSGTQTNEAFVLVIDVPVATQGFFKCKQYGIIVLEVARRYEMQNKIKLVMDDEKILHDGIYDLNSIYSIIDDLLVNRKGLRKDGSFYIDDNPSDSAGVGMACIFTLAGKKWFRENVKELFWYRDISHYKLDHRYKVENAKETVIDTWEVERKANGLSIDR